MFLTSAATVPAGDSAGDDSAGAARPKTPPLALLVVAVAVAGVVVAPMTRRGWVFTLDWSRGPYVAAPRTIWGLDGELLATLPFNLLTLGAGGVLGHATITWLPLGVALVVSVISAGRLAGGSLARQIPAGLLYAVNPFVYERAFAGHVAFLLAYALFPFAVAAILAAVRSPGARASASAVLWVAALAGFAPHFLWIAAVIHVVALVVWPSAKAVMWLLTGAVVTVLANAYLLFPATSSTPVNVTVADLETYRTRGDGLGLVGNLIAMYGFWRREPRLPREVLPGWIFFLAAILLVIVVGAWAAMGSPRRRRFGLALVFILVAGLALASGDKGVSGGLYRWAFQTIPGFEVMREPQKFLTLLVMSYSVFFGFGTEAIARAHRGRPRLTTWMAAVVVLLYTPLLGWGLAGQLRPERYPSAWRAADTLMGSGDGKVLFLPWHQYLSFPFTKRIIANPADLAFRRDVIVGDNVEVAAVSTTSTSKRSRYLEYLFSQGNELRSFGRLVAPLGTEYVVLSRTADWQRYGWLDAQADLRKVLDQDDIVVYRNLVPPAPLASERRLDLADWGELIGAENTATGRPTAAFVEAREPGRVRVPVVGTEADPPAPPSPSPKRTSLTTYHVAAAAATRWVAIPEEHDPRWRVGARTATATAAGTAAVEVPAKGGTVRFTGGSRSRAGIGVSISTVLVLLAIRYRRRGPRVRGSGSDDRPP